MGPAGRPFRVKPSVMGTTVDRIGAELATFADTLRERRLFEPGTAVAVARAPGRLDVMGGIADYSGSLVLERPIAQATWAGAQRLDRPVLDIVSLGRPPCTIPLETLAPGGVAASYGETRRMFAEGPHRWAAYIAGTVFVLARERGLPLTSGVRIVVASQVPEGKGVSSSAAVETASMSAVAAAFAMPIEPRDLAILCQTAENLVAGAPCGVMDQMTCVFGEPQALLALLCQPAELHPPVPVPDDVELWGLDSGERHAVGGSDYGAVRTGAFMGLRILGEHVSVPGNHLANLPLEQFERELVRHLPEEMAGDDFLSRFGGTADHVTSVASGRRYRVRAPASHPVYERWRVEAFRELLLAPAGEARRCRLGELMYESHASYGRCSLGSEGTDRLVALVRAEGPAAGLYGARITGGGSGGTVAVIGRRDAAPAIARVADAYERQTGYRAQVFAGSSPGVAAFATRSIIL
jgi:L-arabinokinase